MGQNPSSPFSLFDFKDEVQRHAQIIKELAVLTYEELLQHIDELNGICSSFIDGNNKILNFKIKPGTDTTFLWKGRIRIGCMKVDVETSMKQVCKILNLQQFLHVYHVITSQKNFIASSMRQTSTEDTPAENQESAPCAASASEETELKKSPMSASMLLNSAVPDEDCCFGTDLEECCICMERKPEVTLPCAHSYCLVCIEQWNVTNKTCPLCREALSSTDDSWVISEAPDVQEVARELEKTLQGLSRSLDR